MHRYLLTILLFIFFINCNSNTKYKNTLSNNKESKTIKESIVKIKEINYSNIDCDSLYKRFLSTNGSIDKSFEDTKPYNYFLNYYECLNYSEEGKYDSIISEIKKYTYISNEKGVILAKKPNKDAPWLSDSYLLDYDLNILYKSLIMRHFYTENFTFASEDKTIIYEYYSEKNNRFMTRKLSSQFRLINKEGEFINDETYCDYLNLGNGYFEVSQDNMLNGTVNSGIIDSTGQIVIPIKYHYFKYNKLNKDNKYIITIKINENNKFKWGLLNLKNEVLIPFSYNEEEFDKAFEKFHFN
jgi:hypothetical protein